jgi:hypothetical protein
LSVTIWASMAGVSLQSGVARRGAIRHIGPSSAVWATSMRMPARHARSIHT